MVNGEAIRKSFKLIEYGIKCDLKFLISLIINIKSIKLINTINTINTISTINTINTINTTKCIIKWIRDMSNMWQKI